ncbi:MAG: DUF6240 domain-containing protein [Lachnospiraceae bacterium]
MDYQIGGNQTGYQNTLYGNTGVGVPNGDGGLFSNNSIGDLLACKLIKAGKEPVLDLNGVQIKTRAANELEGANPGDTIYLKIQSANKNQVSLKIVGVQAQVQNRAENLGTVTNAQVLQTAEQYSEMIQENVGGEPSEEEAKENQKEILRSLTADEIAKLRQMHIDVSNAELSDLMGMVITLRTTDHIEEKNEQLGDIVKETIGKLRNSILAGNNTQKTDTSGDIQTKTESGEAIQGDNSAEFVGTARLNAEGYIINIAKNGSNANYGNAVENPIQEETVIQSDSPIISKEQLVYLIKNGMDLTIENLEVSKNSVNEESPFVELPFNNKVWNDIFPQVTGIIEAAGMSVTEKSQEAAKFMLTHELPITTDSLRLYMAANSINQRGIQVAPLEANIEEQISIGNAPEKARISGSSLQDKANQLVEKINGITDRAVDKAVNQGKPLSISYLYNSSMRSIDVKRMRGPVNTGVEGASLSLSGISAEGNSPESAIPLSTNPLAVTARRQLEEIRLAMTSEAAIRLVRQDINIDAKPLSFVVEQLRKQENSYYDSIVSNRDLHDIPEDMDLLKETLKETDELKSMPEYILGEMVKRPTISVGQLYESGTKLKYTLAGTAYETMMTKPRADMGDSISEAFQNVDDILQDMNMDRNEENQRAVRILAYNEMELTQSNIVSVKAADAKVQQMFDTLTPQIVLNLIRENKNPLNMTIDGLNDEIMQQREIRGITDEQRFSEFLYQMDRQNEITDEERQSFIGIYRLLDKIEKSHGKDIGAVVRNGQEVTLANLFSADKSRKVRGMDFSVDESFGERVDVATDERSILNQIQTAYNQTLTGSIMRHIRPETLKRISDMDYENMTFEELNRIMKAADVPEGQGELIDTLSQELKEALTYEDDVAMMLEANHMPFTATNMIAAHQVMYGENGIYGMIRNIKQNLSKEGRDHITEKENQVLEQLESKDNVIYGLESIRSGLSLEVHNKESDGTITAMDIQALKYLNAGMPIAMRAVEEDIFQVPIVVDGEVSIMKVSIIQDGNHAGEITASMDTAKYGKLYAYIHANGNQIEGYITTEEEKGQRLLESSELTLRSAFAKAGMEVRDLRLDGTKPMQYGLENISSDMETSKLYKIAKQLLTAIKLSGIASDN